MVTPPDETLDEESWEEMGDKYEDPRVTPEDSVDATGTLLDQQPAYDKLINAQVMLQLGSKLQTSKVMQHSIGPDGIVAVSMTIIRC